MFCSRLHTIYSLGVVLGASAVLVSGCASSAWVHPEYKERYPSWVRIAPVQNRTLHNDLGAYTTGGFLQRTLFGPGELNVLQTIEGAAQAKLRSLGYLEPGAGETEADGAELTVAITRWKATANGIEPPIAPSRVSLSCPAIEV